MVTYATCALYSTVQQEVQEERSCDVAIARVRCSRLRTAIERAGGPGVQHGKAAELSTAFLH